jgi:hypothetical protein
MPDECLANLQNILVNDSVVIHEKDKSYRGSWKKRGGVGAFMMLCRKWDRLEAFVEATDYDIFKAIQSDSRGESVLDDIRDLRRYLALVEAEIITQQNDNVRVAVTYTSP